MSRDWKPKKQTVEMRPSRIRREPAPAEKAKAADGSLGWAASEREIWLAIAGVVAFALAIDIIIVAVSAYWK